MPLLEKQSPIEEDFRRHLRANKKMTASTTKRVITRLPKGWIVWPEDQLHEYFFQTLDRTDLSSKTKSHVYYAIKNLCDFRGIKFDYKPPKNHTGRRNSVEPETIWKLLDVVTDIRDQALFLTHLYTGMRPGELLALKKEDIDIDQALITIRDAKCNKSRTIPIHKKPLMLIRRYLATRTDGSPYIFHTKRGEDPMSTTGYRLLLRRYCKKAELKKIIVPYEIRHTFASTWVENNGNLLTLKEILGHSDIKMTELYVTANPRMLKKNYNESCPEF